ncbi:conserved hypothetical protein [Desulfamplus magnetovallimortis]|uniref:DnaJ homologue subfamily C member 28 conserved domain-containing protein n=1 Tax=Desulfamplus magnetovallimortis TaxID=1246637 RepID=A0A1W1H5C3_9BACT|nr:DnaJ family domain-containing protein [Desulfamplus magnetovallimortis]SLM27680.1 conserved hypothetical protein [Desulfamplus magnetovallimortis]
MIPGFQSLVEERIKNAQKKGEFDNLPGRGTPLNLEDMKIPEEFRMAYRVLKNSGFLPPEIELGKKIRQTEELIASLSEDDPSRLKLGKKLNFLMTKLNASRGHSALSATVTHNYRDALQKRIS